MPIVIGMFFLLPLLLGWCWSTCAAACPGGGSGVPSPSFWGSFSAVLVGVGRWNLWESETVSPVTQLLIFPGVPGTALLLGCWLGWRLWRRIWRPRVLDGP